MLAFRRQRHQEIAAKGLEHDANERRVTELYLKAADQLGSEKAPVRLAGLYALERLGKANPEHRQTIVDVLCAYLRMPLNTNDNDGPAFEEERQVRKTAQRVLVAHLRWDHEADFWEHTRLDLDGATLTDHDFRAICVERADFSNARFLGGANFERARFDGDVYFAGASIRRYAVFDEARFSGLASFAGCEFDEDTSFRRAEFCGEVTFVNTRFDQDPRFGSSW